MKASPFKQHLEGYSGCISQYWMSTLTFKRRAKTEVCPITSATTQRTISFLFHGRCAQEGELLKGLRKGKDVQMRVSENAQSKQSQGLQNFSVLEKHR